MLSEKRNRTGIIIVEVVAVVCKEDAPTGLSDSEWSVETLVAHLLLAR